jgi:glucan-binding YG repeat protein
MKLNHHGTGKGNIVELLEAISPTYSFAENGTSNGYSTKTGRWNTYTALTRASRYGVCYLVGNEKKTVIYNVKNDVITMYKGNTTASAKKLSGWVELVGSDGKYRSIAMYYIKNNQVLTGIQKIGGYYYNLGTGGCMVYGTYNSKTSYSPWNTEEGGIRCYVLSKDKKYARMQFGFANLSGKLFYMDENGYRVTPEVTDQSAFTKINGRKYVMDARGQILTNQFVTMDGKDYYLNSKGNIVTGTMKKIDDFYYIFDEDGSVMYTPEENSFVEYDGKKYGVDSEGAVFIETKAEIDGDIYYFGKTGGRAKNKIVKIGKSYYYFGSDCTMVTGEKVKISGKSYYFGSNGKMYRNRYVRLSNGKKYHCDKNGVMKLVDEEE